MGRKVLPVSWSQGWQQKRKYFFILVHLYIVFHFLAWYVFDWQFWGKTAMLGLLSLVGGKINAAAIMIVLILTSILLYGRLFCGWFCHLRGSIEFFDWVLYKLNIGNYRQRRSKNELKSVRYRWVFRGLVLLTLLTPVIGYHLKGQFQGFQVQQEKMPPLADLPGFEDKLFQKELPVNVDITWAIGDFFLVGFATFFILFVIGFVMNYHMGQGAFCRVLCPYPVLFAPLMNKLPWQSKITKVGDCTGCRSCSASCPQGIDVSREIFHFEGKVTSLECIKCYRCIDACDDNVLVDTMRGMGPQSRYFKAYEKTPWIKGKRNQQVEDDFPVWMDVVSIAFAVFVGTIASNLGGFWFYVGSILSFILIRLNLKLFLPKNPTQN